jgi:hypothetical protein
MSSTRERRDERGARASAILFSSSKLDRDRLIGDEVTASWLQDLYAYLSTVELYSRTLGISRIGATTRLPWNTIGMPVFIPCG